MLQFYFDAYKSRKYILSNEEGGEDKENYSIYNEYSPSSKPDKNFQKQKFVHAFSITAKYVLVTLLYI